MPRSQRGGRPDEIGVSSILLRSFSFGELFSVLVLLPIASSDSDSNL